VNDPAVTILFDDNGRVYRPGETLSGRYVLDSTGPGKFKADDVKAVEVSVMWYSEGKGDEDFAVHEFWRRDVDEGAAIDVARSESFSTILPRSPLSYDGQILKLRWCVRIRAFLGHGKEVVGQKTFRLGEVPVVGDQTP